MIKPIFITGIGTGVGKTVVSAIVAEALHADYWKPIQAGFGAGTDTAVVEKLISNKESKVHHEFYKLTMPASPHIAASHDNVTIDLDVLERSFRHLSSVNPFLIIEGAGGLMVPLNEHDFVIDLIEKLEAQVIIVSRNYLGSINHSLMTAQMCRLRNIDVLGWIFNDNFMDYENDIVKWTGYPSLGNVKFSEEINQEFICGQAKLMRLKLMELLEPKPEKLRIKRKTKLVQE